MRYAQRGHRFQETGNFPGAFVALKNSYRLNPQPTVALSLGDISRQLEKFSVAQSWYRRAENSAKKNHDPTVTMDARLGLAMCERGQENFGQAILLFKKLLKSYALTDREARAYVLWALGTTQRFAGRFGDAENNLRRSLKLYLEMGDSTGAAYARCGLGGTLRMKGNYAESFSLYRRAATRFLKIRDLFGLAYSNCGQGNALRMMGRIQAGLPYMARAESLYRRIKLKGPLGFVLWSRAQADIALGRFSDGKRRLNESRRLFNAVRDERGLVYCDLGEGQLRLAQNNPSATVFFRRALSVASRRKLPFEATHARRRLLLEKSPCKINQIP